MSNVNKYLNNQPQIFVDALLAATCGEGESDPKIAEFKGFPKKANTAVNFTMHFRRELSVHSIVKRTKGDVFFLFATEYLI